MSLISSIYNRCSSSPYKYQTKKQARQAQAHSAKDRKLSKRQYLKKLALKDKRCQRCGRLKHVQEFLALDKTIQRFCGCCIALFKRCPHKAPPHWVPVPLEQLEKTFSPEPKPTAISITAFPPEEPTKPLVSKWIDERPLPPPKPRKKKKPLTDEEKIFWTKYRRRTRSQQATPKPKKKRGLKPSTPQHGPIRVLVKDGKPLLPSSLRPDLSCPKGSRVGIGEGIGPQRNAAKASTPLASSYGVVLTGKPTTY